MTPEAFIDLAERAQWEEAVANGSQVLQPGVLRRVLTEYMKTADGRAKIAQSYLSTTETSIDRAVNACVTGIDLGIRGVQALRLARIVLSFMSVCRESNELEGEHVKALWGLMGELEDWGRQCLAAEDAKAPERSRLLSVLQAYGEKPIRTGWQRLLDEKNDEAEEDDDNAV